MTLRFRAIRHTFSALPVLKGVDLDIEDGEIVSLLGPSGSGKSTLLRLAAGLERVQEGEIYFGDSLIASAQIHTAPENREVGLVFQDHALFPHMTVRDNIAFGLSNMPHNEVQSIIEAQLDGVGLSGFSGRFPHTLSGGQQQRVALARALAPAPKVLLLDEPFASIDVALRARLREDTRQVLRRSGTTAVMVTHDPEEAMEVSDRIAIMNDGNLVQVGTPQELYTAPHSAFVAAFFGGAQTLAGRPSSNAVMTPFGPIPCRDLPSSNTIVVAVHPDAVRVQPSPHGADDVCRILDVRFKGDHWLVFIEAAMSSQQTVPLLAKLQDVNGLEPGSSVNLEFDPDKVFVFPA